MNNANFMEKLLEGVEVEWKIVEEIFDLKNGYTPSKSNTEYWTDGDIHWFRMEDIRENGQILNQALQKVSKSGIKGKLFAANSIIISTSATIGEHALITVPYLSNQRFTNLTLKDDYSNRFEIKFIFYYCFLLSDWCKNNTTVSSFAAVDMNGFRKFQIPIPPLAIQVEIVRILDAFTAHTAELTAELKARKKQYNFYRDQLLTFEDGDVEWKPLGKLCSINVGQAPNGNEIGVYPFVNAGTTPSGYLSIYNTEPDTITTPSRGQGGIGFVDYQTTRFWCGPLCYRIRSTNKIITTRFLYYVMSNSMKNIIELANMVGVPALNKKELVGFPVPIPSLAEQARIVAILDKFDALTNSITEGLPREIELRQQQYAYYRDLLLSFPKPAPEAPLESVEKKYG
jgi:type I restriction enzyme S subunit